MQVRAAEEAVSNGCNLLWLEVKKMTQSFYPNPKCKI
jgi:hypothetical protein